MPFTFEIKEISDVILVESTPFPDERGFFLESFKESEFEENGIPFHFPQDNTSFSIKGVIRGLHFQLNDNAQGKLVAVPSGKVFDVAVDIRPDSNTFGMHVAEVLSSENNRMLWIPPGFAHGFQAIEDSIVHYKVTSEFVKGSESGIRWDDDELSIRWPLPNPVLSEKDRKWKSFESLKS